MNTLQTRIRFVSLFAMVFFCSFASAIGKLWTVPFSTSAAGADVPMDPNRLGAAVCGGKPCIPGLDVMGVGFDAVIGSCSGLQPVFNFTFSDPPDLYVNPFNDTLQYAVPNEVSVRDNTASRADLTSSTYFDADTYGYDLSHSAGIKGFLNAFSGSASYKYAKQVLTDSGSFGAFTVTTSAVTLYDITLKSPLELRPSPGFQKAIDLLPQNYDPDVYMQFLRTFGTHYVSSCTFGGMGQMTSAVNREYSRTSSSVSISAQAGFNFQFISAGGRGSSSSNQASEQFLNGSVFQTTLVGGDPTMLKDWDTWLKTFYNAPARIETRVSSLAMFISSIDDKYKAIAENVEQAVSYYVGNASAACSKENSNIKHLNDALGNTQQIISCIQNLQTCFCWGSSSFNDNLQDDRGVGSTRDGKAPTPGGFACFAVRDDEVIDPSPLSPGHANFTCTTTSMCGKITSGLCRLPSSGTDNRLLPITGIWQASLNNCMNL